MAIAKEEMLEVDKLLEAQKAASASLANDQQLETIKDKQAEDSDVDENSTDETSTDASVDESNDTGGTSGDELDAPESTDESELKAEPEEESSEDTGEDKQEDTEFKDAVESLSVASCEVSTESWDDVKYNVGRLASTAAATIGYIASLGIQYTPIVATKLYKGVAVIMGVLTKQLFKGIYVTTKYLERRKNSVENLQEDIKGIKSSIEQINSQEAKDIEGVVYNNTSVINSLKIGECVDFTANVATLNAFLSDIISSLDKGLHNDIGAIRHIVSAVAHSATYSPSANMSVPKLSTNMVTGGIDSYGEGIEGVEVMHYKNFLPGDRVFIAALPSKLTNEMEAITTAYNHSKIYFGINQSDFKAMKSVVHMPADKLSEFVDSLDELCALCAEHQKYYETIKKLKSELRFTFRDYFRSLIASSVRVSIKDSLINLVQLKTMYVDKVYLVGAMDIHDYATKVISDGVKLARDNIKVLQ